MQTVVVGREAELGELDATFDRARDGLAGLVFEGDPGIGKTTLWRKGLAIAADRRYRILSCRAVPAEARLSFAALSDLLAPVETAAFDILPHPQRQAIDAALLRSTSVGGAPDPRAIGTALVTLITQLAGPNPVLIALDDLQWLDAPSAGALQFAFRRLEARPVAIVATVRTGERSAETSLLSPPDERVKTLRVGPLSVAALYRIVENQLGRGLPRPLLIRIEQACRGNPFYALEIVRALDTEGGPPAYHRDLPIPADLRDLVAARLRKLPRRTREALLRISAMAQPSIAAINAADLGPAEDADVVRIGPDGRIAFTHPLFANAIYAAASHDRRRTLHQELAETAVDLEERARHLLLARGDDADEDFAGVLHEAAEHARRRGAVEVAADLEEQSAHRTPAPQTDVRWQRFLRAARHHLKAGDPLRSRALCDNVLAGATAVSIRAHALHLLAEISATDRPEAAVPLLEEALACAGDDVRHAAQLETSLGIIFYSGIDLARGHRHLIRAVQLAERANDTAVLAEALALRAAGGIVSGQGFDEAMLERALALEDPDHDVPFQMRVSLNAAQAYEYVGRVDIARTMFDNLRQRLVARGEERDLPWVLSHLAATDWLLGNLERAEQEASDAERVATLTGVELFRAFGLSMRATVRAIRGNTDGARVDGTEALSVAQRIGWLVGVSEASGAMGLLALSEGDAKAAAVWLSPVVAAVEAFGVYEFPIAVSVPNAIEAFVATGELERADRLSTALAAWGARFDRPWASATAGRCRALVDAARGDLDGAAKAAELAIVHHARLPMPFELARTLLVQGGLHRRRGKRRAARLTLQRALGIFQEIGSAPWAEKARDEIARIGVRRAPEHLTEGEQRAAELAATGLTNPEIAARLFMSRRTVEANLARAYRKLDIRSRAELGAALAKGRLPGTARSAE